MDGISGAEIFKHVYQRNLAYAVHIGSWYIALQELFMAAKTVGGNYYKYFESYLVIAVIYFVLCFVFDKLFKLIEKKLQGKTDYALAVEYMDNE